MLLKFFDIQPQSGENMGNVKVFWAVNPEELHQREQSCNLVSFLEFEVISQRKICLWAKEY